MTIPTQAAWLLAPLTLLGAACLWHWVIEPVVSLLARVVSRGASWLDEVAR
jgi:hypothetical protein